MNNNDLILQAQGVARNLTYNEEPQGVAKHTIHELCHRLDRYRWISVRERIPRPEVFVLCWDGKTTFVEWFGSKPDAGRGVTHWMPYPMPPGATSDMHDGRRA